MRFSELKSSILAQFQHPLGNRVVPFIVGKPGGGKSSVAREIAIELQARFDIPNDRIVEFNPSLREPSDVLGLPQFNGECTKWLPPEEFYALRHGVGPCVLIIEELSDAQIDMQNPLCRVILDRYAGNLKLSDQLYIIATGNRTEDKSGANRLSTKLANRMRTLEFTENLDDWIEWATANGVSPLLTAFIRWRPNLLSDFDPNRPRNPTPRSWADVALVPEDLPEQQYYDHVAGAVGDGAAAEYVGFRKIFDSLPDYELIKSKPATAPIPKEESVLFALCAKLVSDLTKDNVLKMWKYIQRLRPEFCAMVMLEAQKRDRRLASSKAFVEFCALHGAALTAV